MPNPGGRTPAQANYAKKGGYAMNADTSTPKPPPAGRPTMTPDELDAIEARHHLFCAAPWCGTPLVERRQWCALARTIAALREAEAAIARVNAVLAQHWDWKAGRALAFAIRAALDGEA